MRRTVERQLLHRGDRLERVAQRDNVLVSETLACAIGHMIRYSSKHLWARTDESEGGAGVSVRLERGVDLGARTAASKGRHEGRRSP